MRRKLAVVDLVRSTLHTRQSLSEDCPPWWASLVKGPALVVLVVASEGGGGRGGGRRRGGERGVGVVLLNLGEEPGDEGRVEVGSDQVGELRRDLVCEREERQVRKRPAGPSATLERTCSLAVTEHDETVLPMNKRRQ